MEITREPVPVFDFPNTKNKKKLKEILRRSYTHF